MWNIFFLIHIAELNATTSPNQKQKDKTKTKININRIRVSKKLEATDETFINTHTIKTRKTKYSIAVNKNIKRLDAARFLERPNHLPSYKFFGDGRSIYIVTLGACLTPFIRIYISHSRTETDIHILHNDRHPRQRPTHKHRHNIIARANHSHHTHTHVSS